MRGADTSMVDKKNRDAIAYVNRVFHTVPMVFHRDVNLVWTENKFKTTESAIG